MGEAVGREPEAGSLGDLGRRPSEKWWDRVLSVEMEEMHRKREVLMTRWG